MRAVLLSLLVACSSKSSAPPPVPTVEAASKLPRTEPTTAADRARWKTEGLAAYDGKQWPVCGSLLDRAGDPYNAACCHALGAEPDRAFASLQRAVDDGFRDGAHLANDPDLASLRTDPRWQPLVDVVTARAAEYRAKVNGELADLYTADQADRAGAIGAIDWKVVGPRDEARRQRVDAILAAGGAKVAADYYHAAMVYQHGSALAEIQRAHELAVKAVSLDATNDAAKWLAAAAEDRALMYQQQPQKYGTQFQKQQGTWVVWQVDPSITDEQRAAWNVPPLAEAHARAAQMNATP